MLTVSILYFVNGFKTKHSPVMGCKLDSLIYRTAGNQWDVDMYMEKIIKPKIIFT